MGDTAYLSLWDRKMKEKRYLICGIFFATIIAVIFTILLYQTRFKVEHQNYPKNVLDESNNAFFYVEDVTDDGRKIQIKGCAQDAELVGEYHNWVLGSGTSNYQNCEIALVAEDNMDIYCLKTYFYSFDPVNIQQVDSSITQQYGIMAQTKKSKIKSGRYKLAVVFHAADETEYLKYPEEDIYVEID